MAPRRPAPRKRPTRRPASARATAAHADAEAPRRRGPTWPVLALGASAGGIRSLQRLLEALPGDLPAAVLVVLHLGPGQHLAPLLAKASRLPVSEAKPGETLRPGRVYVAKGDRHLEVARGRLRLTAARRVRFARPSIDLLFDSVAREYGDRAVAVLLSGSGSDGVQGMLKVKEAEGTTVAEHRSTAEYPAMPEAAVRLGAADLVLPVDELAAFLVRLCQGQRPRIREGHWTQLLALLRKRFGTDFGAYKISTLHRRLEKRLLATGQKDLGDYLKLLARQPEELEQLHAAFLIKVSSFFRDAEAWKDLQEKVVKPLVRNAKPRQELRVWSAGCATGEEAYTLALVFLEAIKDPSVSVKVFATDLDDRALETARLGVYEQAQVADLPPRLRQTYFEPLGTTYRVRKELRRHVIFGKHDVLRDPPIAGLDLLVCRNVLIYFNQDQKRALLERLAYALKPGGVLFLGKSEGILEVESQFEPLSSKSRLFRKGPSRYVAPPLVAPREMASAEQQLREAMEEGVRGLQAHEAFAHLLLQSASVVLVTVDAERRVALWNRAAEQFFGVPAEKALGRSFFEVLEGVGTDRLGKALKRAVAERSTVELRGVPYQGTNRPPAFLDLDIAPLAGKKAAGSALLIGVNVTARHEAESSQRDLLQQLRRSVTETAQANDALQSTNEELETLNEELQSAAEEQQTLNEELQSSNEELETTNEELQSTNEELNTLNEELRLRSEELERVTSFLRGVLDSAPESVVVCDEEDRVTFWSSAASQLFRLSDAQAVGRDLFSLVPALETAPMRQAVRQVLQKRQPVVVEDLVLAPKGQRVRLSLSVVEDRSGQARGYILLAADVTKRALREEDVRRNRDLLNLYNRLLTHDLNNLSQGLGAHLELAHEGPPERARQHLRAAGGLLKRTSALVRNVQLLNNLGPGAAKPKRVEAAAALAEAVAMVRLAFPEADAKIVTDVGKGFLVEADATLIQVFFNLLSNAVEHGGPGVEVHATASRGSLGARPAVVLTLRDTGPGLPAAARAKLAEDPLGPPEGTGLGLYIARALVASWGGALTAAPADAAKRGTELRLVLPAAAGPRRPRRQRTASP